MHKANREDIAPRLLTREQACTYTSMGRNSLDRWADSIGAVRKIGTMKRYDRKVIDEALDAMNNEMKDAE